MRKSAKKPYKVLIDMKKTVTITIKVDMDSEQSKEWHKPSDYFNESVKAAMEKIGDKSIVNTSGTIETDSESCSYVVNIKSDKRPAKV